MDEPEKLNTQGDIYRGKLLPLPGIKPLLSSLQFVTLLTEHAYISFPFCKCFLSEDCAVHSLINQNATVTSQIPAGTA
jgi:hypothetical protein